MLIQEMEVVMAPEHQRVRMLVQCQGQMILSAVFGPKSLPEALCNALRGLATHQPASRLSVVLSVSERDNGYGLRLLDALSVLAQSVPCQIGVATNLPVRRRKTGEPHDYDLACLSLTAPGRSLS